MSRSLLAGAAFLLATALPAFAAETFEAQLDPAPFDATTRANVIGSIGQVKAVLDGDTLTIAGSFSQMTSPATGASLRIGLAKGVVGDEIGKLTAQPAPEGNVSGSVKLTPAQIAMLRKEAIYVRVDSVKAPDGNLQGWLEAPSKESK
jgi:hypothetical protein